MAVLRKGSGFGCYVRVVLACTYVIVWGCNEGVCSFIPEFWLLIGRRLEFCDRECLHHVALVVGVAWVDWIVRECLHRVAWVDWMVRECLHRMALVMGVAWVDWMGSACIAWHEWWEWHGSTGW